jgi:hypothetical protein
METLRMVTAHVSTDDVGTALWSASVRDPLFVGAVMGAVTSWAARGATDVVMPLPHSSANGRFYLRREALQRASVEAMGSFTMVLSWKEA